MRSITLDTETTGLDFKTDRIVEIGAVELFNDAPTGRTYHVYCNPGIPVPLAAQEVHGLTDAFLADKPPMDPDPLLAFLQDSPIIAHNAAFDVGMLNAELARFGLPPLANTVIDSLALARRRHPGAPASLDALCKRYGASTAARTKHGALLDAELLAAVYIDLLGRQAGFDLGVAKKEHEVTFSLPVRPSILQPRLTADDLAAHKAMISRIPEAIWARLSVD
jgi:DNA polymerase-3 subunit epsilon